MATTQDIATVRDFAAEPDNTNGWTDVKIGGVIDAKSTEGVPDLESAPAYIWGIKASQLAALVNVSENGSSRSMGDLYKNAMQMASHFKSISESNVVVISGRPRTRAIARP